MFTGYLNAGDLDGVISLYELDARFVTRSGEVLVGREQVRRVVAALIDAKTVLESRVVKAVAAGDTAILYTDFCGRTVDAAGINVEIRDRAIEVLRAQPHGGWRLVIGDPIGRTR